MAGGGATIDVPSPGPMPPGAPSTVPAVRLTGVRKTFGEVVAVEELTLDVLPGEFFTMLGPSGSGKTTTLRVIAGFELADAGTVQLHGVDVTRSPPYERPLNTVFQDYFDSIKFWKTPVAECGNGQSDCMDYSKWQQKWTEVTG